MVCELGKLVDKHFGKSMLEPAMVLVLGQAYCTKPLSMDDMVAMKVLNLYLAFQLEFLAQSFPDV